MSPIPSIGIVNSAITKKSKYILLSASTSRHSTDGITWTTSTVALPVTRATFIGKSNNVYLATVPGGGVSTGNMLTSTNGITWTLRTCPNGGGTTSWGEYIEWKVAAGPGGFAAVSYGGNVGGNQAMNSTDGITWTTRSTVYPTRKMWKHIQSNGSSYVAIADMNADGSSGSGQTLCIRSTDGITWSYDFNLMDAYPYSYGSFIGTSNGYVALLYGYSVAQFSTDGLTWVPSNMPTSTYNAWNNLASNGMSYAAIEHATGKGAYSTNGTTWTSFTLPSPLNSGYYNISANKRTGQYLAVDFWGYGYTATSYNGTTWTRGTDITNGASAIWAFDY